MRCRRLLGEIRAGGLLIRHQGRIIMVLRGQVEAVCPRCGALNHLLSPHPLQEVHQ